MEAQVFISVVSNGFILNGEEVFECDGKISSRQDALKRLLNRVLEEIGADSWKAEVIG